MPDSPRTPPPGDRPEGKKLPGTYRAFAAKFPEVVAQHERMAKAVDAAGPLDAKTTFLIKIGISLGAGLESALRSHVRRAMAAGATEQEVEQAILLGMNTCGFPATVAAWSWAQVQFARERADREARGEPDDEE
ncbi:carboxymuconolactone decarboxylase family protein [Alienimonas californiensis]|uniref:Carboxymuconolactone decarboxylase family protein n=1 Tax=Alienimonas californiensis TaxID=2527989 RepID=A0A517PDZ6_9PLAN|nr:carboxymuconolactone decarboxylase family protein [Alienimonas californiensis]QDT17602.1 Carboxymuconolactone decarboxylase family protein [Alienimonas californiensis]